MIWYSQSGQDKWVYEQIGASGFAVDVGAHDGVTTSNTYALEQAGWIGICVEPDHALGEACRANRSGSRTTIAAATDRDGWVWFDGMQVTGVYDRKGDKKENRCVTGLTLATILAANDAPDTIDYLSVDVEGHELQVLAGMDFDRWHVRLITIEHNAYRDGPALRDAIRVYLAERGFELAVADVGCVDPCPPPAYPGAEFEDWYVNGAEPDVPNRP